MATIKSYTDLNQSRRLAEILPIESADMWYCPYPNDVDWYDEPRIGKAELLLNQLPCWSLAALLGALPTTIGNFFEKNALRLRMDKGENDFNIWYEYFDCWDVAKGLDVKEGNPIDACVEIIIKLYEQNFL